jgi:hypothetical protein
VDWICVPRPTREAPGDLFPRALAAFGLPFSSGPTKRRVSVVLIDRGRVQRIGVHLAKYDVMLGTVSRAPLAKLQTFERRMGWTLSAKRGAICEEAG